MLASLRRELELRHGLPSALASHYDEPRDPFRECQHTPDQHFTREPCSCGRPLWPPRGRGRGESPSSPRRIAAMQRTCEAHRLYAEGWSYEAIARALGYRDRSGPWRALQRLRDWDAAWRNYEARTGHHPRWRDVHPLLLLDVAPSDPPDGRCTPDAIPPTEAIDAARMLFAESDKPVYV